MQVSNVTMTFERSTFEFGGSEMRRTWKGGGGVAISGRAGIERVGLGGATRIFSWLPDGTRYSSTRSPSSSDSRSASGGRAGSARLGGGGEESYCKRTCESWRASFGVLTTVAPDPRVPERGDTTSMDLLVLWEDFGSETDVELRDSQGIELEMD